MKRYHVTTFGCQMNAHDSERIKGMLEELGLGEAHTQDEADVLVFNTCTVREKPDQRFAAHLAQAAALKRREPDKVIAVGGCYAEAQRERLFSLYPYVDVAFGPGSIPHLADWLGAGAQAPRGRFAEWQSFAGDLPARRERPFQAWVQISMGCNSRCSYCIVPAVRGREQSRRPGDILAEVERLAADGVREITLLGQNVNSWGRDLAPALTTEFGELLRACDAIPGIERIRFTSPHPKDFRRPVIEAMAECSSVCEHAHLPLQSGSTAVLKRMRRTYSRERYLALVERMRDAVPDLALTTDLIVGFPGETEDDFVELIEFVRNCRFDNVGVFTYSDEEGTAAFDLPDKVDPKIAKQRRNQLMKEQAKISKQLNRARVGQTFPVMFEGLSQESDLLFQGRLEGQTQEIDGYILINDMPENFEPQIGSIYNVRVTEAHDYDLVGEIVGG